VARSAVGTSAATSFVRSSTTAPRALVACRT
jgi:hypothetical protein